MRNRRKQKLAATAYFVGPAVVLVGFVFFGGPSGVAISSDIAFVGFVVGCAVYGGRVVLVRRRRGLQSPVGLRVVLPRAARSLRWVSRLLPGDEGAIWWAEVTSCLAEAHEPGERRRYIRSYPRGVPRLIWTSWTTQLSASRRRTLS